MRRFRPLLALFLAMLWLPATLHCGLEQVSAWGDAGCCPASHSSDETHNPCAADSCEIVEGGLYKLSSMSLKVAAPQLLSCLFCLVEITPAVVVVPLLSPERSDSPPELALTWQFTVRAAALPGAPFLVA